jgi:hypothetical protein
MLHANFVQLDMLTVLFQELALFLHGLVVHINVSQRSDHFAHDDAVDDRAHQHDENHVPNLPVCQSGHVAKTHGCENREYEVHGMKPLRSPRGVKQRAIIIQLAALEPRRVHAIVENSNEVPATTQNVRNQDEARSQVQ